MKIEVNIGTETFSSYSFLVVEKWLKEREYDWAQWTLEGRNGPWTFLVYKRIRGWKEEVIEELDPQEQWIIALKEWVWNYTEGSNYWVTITENIVREHERKACCTVEDLIDRMEQSLWDKDEREWRKKHCR